MIPSNSTEARKAIAKAPDAIEFFKLWCEHFHNLIILLNLSDVNLTFYFRSIVEKCKIVIYEQTNFKRHHSTTF